MINFAQGGIRSEHSWPGSISNAVLGESTLHWWKIAKIFLCDTLKRFQKPTLHVKNHFEKNNIFYMFSFVLTISICGALFSILWPQLSGTLRHFICTGSSIQYNQRFPCNDFFLCLQPGIGQKLPAWLHSSLWWGQHCHRVAGESVWTCPAHIWVFFKRADSCAVHRWCQLLQRIFSSVFHCSPARTHRAQQWVPLLQGEDDDYFYNVIFLLQTS